MKYVTSIERQGIEKGLQQGVQQGVQQTSEKFVLRYLTKEVCELDAATTTIIQRLPLDRLTALSDAMFEFKTASELAKWLSESAPAESAALSN